MGWVVTDDQAKVVCDRCRAVGQVCTPGRSLQAQTKTILWAMTHGWAVSPKFDIAYCACCRPYYPLKPYERDFTPSRYDKILKS